ncbi:hypothetical protein ADL25_35480 [Streptomyces sp. NRRL F-5122]|nr:hypothetical protein ADL25_35480 [Streptomyces sp. NRRL F-5122]
MQFAGPAPALVLFTVVTCLTAFPLQKSLALYRASPGGGSVDGQQQRDHVESVEKWLLRDTDQARDSHQRGQGSGYDQKNAISGTVQRR